MSSYPVLRIRAYPGCIDGESQGFDAMESVSWTRGEVPVTATPEFADPFLVHLVHYVNDSYCTHLSVRGGVEWLCVDCTTKVLALADRTVDSLLAGWPRSERERLYIRLAFDELEAAAPAVGPTPYTRRVASLLEQWIEQPSSVDTRMLHEAVEAKPLDGTGIDRAAGDLLAAVRADGTIETPRWASRCTIASITARSGGSDLVEFHRLFDRFDACTALQFPDDTSPRIVRLK